DRRRLLILGQLWMLSAAFTLGLLCIFNIINPWILLGLTFMMAIGAVITGPAWNAAIPELVSKDNLEPAIALGSMGYNVARGIGSAIGGLAVAALGPGPVFILNAISFLGVIVVFMKWKRQRVKYSTAREKVSGAIRAGLRFVRHSPALKSIFVRSATYACCSSAMWALLPLIAREKLHLSSGGYGLLLAFFGLGTLVGAAILPRLRKTVSLDDVTTFGKLLFGGALVGLAYAQNGVTASLFMIGFGLSWIVVNSCLNVGAQKASPAWVRARALSVHILVFLGCFAISSALWGELANHYGLDTPLLIAAVGLGLSLLLAKHFPLGIAESLDTTLSDHWTDPNNVIEPHPDHGPVVVTVEYFIDPERSREFAEAMRALSLQRKRDGAFQWHLFCDVSNPSRHVETFFVESWAEHLRQHERVTVSDKEAEDKVNSFHIGPQPPVVHHLINAYMPDSSDKELVLLDVNIN
ncbi:MAG TPA: MFS transporter, partial [Candidatus Obscuribacterales bacterium]